MFANGKKESSPDSSPVISSQFSIHYTELVTVMYCLTDAPPPPGTGTGTAGEDKAVMYGNFTIVCASSPCETDNPILEHNCSYKAL